MVTTVYINSLLRGQGRAVYDYITKPFFLKISVGKMNFSFTKQKGVLDRAFIPIKVPLHRESSHSEVLAKCINQVFTYSVLPYFVSVV